MEQSEVSRLERGKRPPSLDLMRRFASFFGVSLDFMAGNDDSQMIPVSHGEPPVIKGAIPVGPSVMLPVLGTIRAGQPVLAAQEVIGYEPADMETVRNGEFFYLTVKGDSMIGDHIPDGALVLVRRQECAEPHEIAVVIVNGDEATLKRLKCTDSQIVLTASNPRHPVQIYPMSEVQVIGIVIEWKIKMKR